MIIIPGYSKNYLDSKMPKCDKIVHHAQHAYDERGRVIVVDLADEDRQEYINSFASECGLKNVLARLVKSGDALGYQAMRYRDEEAQDVSDLPTKVNEVVAEGSNANSRIQAALGAFNEKTGLNLTLEQFLKASEDGSLLDLVADNLNKKDGDESNGS